MVERACGARRLGRCSGVGLDARGGGEGERGRYGRVKDGIADRVEGRHGIPALPHSLRLKSFSAFRPFLGSLVV